MTGDKSGCTGVFCVCHNKSRLYKVFYVASKLHKCLKLGGMSTTIKASPVMFERLEASQPHTTCEHVSPGPPQWTPPPA